MTRASLMPAALSICLLASSVVAARAADATAAQWARETTEQIQKSFLLIDRNLYADEMDPMGKKPGGPAFTWGVGVQLSALAAAAAVDRKAYEIPLRRYADMVQVYWQHPDKGVAGFDVLPVPKGLDRYYDDNAWLVLAFVETHEVTRDPLYLLRAEETMQFVMSGEDDKLGGGVYWHEQGRDSKNTCSNAPTIAGLLRLYQATHKQEYRDAAERLYKWTNANLQDTDGLYWDNVKLDGRVEKTKWSYNTALMTRSNCLFYDVTRDPKYLKEAQRLADACVAKWVDPTTGGIRDGAAFAHLLSESFLFLAERDHNAKWRQVVRRALTYLHDKARDPNGYYASPWDRPQTEALTKAKLIDQASAARAYWMGARLGAR